MCAWLILRFSALFGVVAWLVGFCGGFCFLIVRLCCTVRLLCLFWCSRLLLLAILWAFGLFGYVVGGGGC